MKANFKKIALKNYCYCGSDKKYDECHGKYDPYIKEAMLHRRPVPTRKHIKTMAQLDGMRKSAEINVAVLDYVAANIGVGMSTDEIDKMVFSKTKEMGGIPAPLNYEGFPKSVCTSRNEVVCHGIPSTKEFLEDGDIVNVDCSTILNGYYSDSSRTFMIGNVSEEKQRLVKVARECMYKGLEQVKPLARLGDVGNAVNVHAEANGYKVVRSIGGHGIGLDFHEDPWVSFVSKPNTGMLLIPGMVFTIEPMVNMGTSRITTDKKNGWTVRTGDLKPSAQWEIMVLVTEDGYEVMSW